MDLTLQPVPVNTSTADEDGCLIFADGQLMAVIVQLDGSVTEDLRGQWYLEVGFGPCSDFNHPTFASAAEAEDWVRSRLSYSN